MESFIDLKIRTWFKMNNMKRNGSMSKADFSEIADKFKAEYDLADSQYLILKKWLCDGWDILLKEGQELEKSGQAGGLTTEKTPKVFEICKTLNDGGAITEDQYASAYEELVEVNKTLFQRKFENMVSAFFDVFDTDNDGLIDVNDLIRGLRCLGIQQEEATKMMFANMDKAKNGNIPKLQYIAEWLEFMLGDRKDAAIASVLCMQ